METIYKGAAYDNLTITSDIPLASVAIYCSKRKQSAQFAFTQGMEGSNYVYACTLTDADTSALSVGVYSLECYAEDGTMAACVHNFARVLTSSKQKQ